MEMGWTTKPRVGMNHYQAFQGVAQETESLVAVVPFQHGTVNRVMTEGGK